MLITQELTYIHPDKEMLFGNINLAINKHDKIALIGNNGAGKSTLLKIMAGALPASGGLLKVVSKPYYIPQHFGQYNHLTIAAALQVEDKLNALQEILKGNASNENFATLNDDWSVEERCADALARWQLEGLELSQTMASLSGGEKTKVFLAGISIHHPEIVLLDEPSNHLDQAARQALYNFIRTSNATMVVVSHDRKLLNLLHSVYELSNVGITLYGGNYEFYENQKQIEQNALYMSLQSKEKALRKAREAERETLERQQKLDARGKKKQEKAGVPKIMMNTLRNNAENSTSRLKAVHTEKLSSISQDLSELRKELPHIDKIKLGFDDATLHQGKTLFTAVDINYRFGDKPLWTRPLNIWIKSGERISLKGDNGSGKTTLIKLLLGQLEPASGSIRHTAHRSVYIDQDYSLIRNDISVYEQAQRFNLAALQEHEVKIRLSRFLFAKDDWNKCCRSLSGGEKMRLMLCCLTISNQAPDIIVLDEPTNNLDIQNIEILTTAVSDYKGTLIVISHDELFLEQVGIERVIDLNEVRN
ncbi:ABC-F family ATP-binding cassette domain-containing protein [Paradesertivirga mongoliensis]|uniref:ABC-F family ATP-binding cassette domain-containing protein n=1 Tax=Paradesertivirga mongoliensis TaxID=2100740 RepID=A0ABW4ZHL6_9SPHI|nr:ABC-F family ATP-binding cassette domain-containing protein [Pedobacter mongoliensis]